MMQRVGLCASALCAVHCMVMPFVLAAQPLFHWFRISRAADNALLTLAAVVGLIVCLRNLRQHRDLGPLTLMFVGLAAVGFGRFFAWPPLIIGGPLVMAYGLWLNRRLCACPDCRH
jgi:hypothetical protein